jgi:adenylate cyclase
MAEARVERRLAAILAADVAGYSRLMGLDEEGTLAALKACRQDLIDPKIAEYRGRIVKTAGDGALVEFASVVDAVRCAIDIQRAATERNADVPGNRQLVFRIGINVGDIIIDEGDIYGDGVNVAARIEALAEPGGICLSGNVYEHVRSTKLDAEFVDLGEQNVKNIAQPVRVYKVNTSMVSDARPTQEAATSPSDLPSIAVLPFLNISGDSDQEYFADGLAEDIITALSRIRHFFVLARNTTFTYKGRVVNVQAAAKDLGVKYVLEGSVRKVGNVVRISVQLIDGKTGNHLWAERYDRGLEDIFAVQDDITLSVVGTIEPEISRAEQERARAKPPASLHAWDYYLRGLWHLWRFSRTDVIEAQDQFRRAIQIDPKFGPSYAALSFAQLQIFNQGLSDNPAAALHEAFDTATKAIAVDDRDPLPHWAKAFVFLFRREYESAIDEGRTAIELNPSFAPAYTIIGHAHSFNGRPAEALRWYESALQRSPKDPRAWLIMMGRAFAYYYLGDWEKAEAYGRQATHFANAHLWAYAIHAAALAKLHATNEARAVLQKIRDGKPNFSVEIVRETAPMNASMMELFIEGLREAGLDDR